MITLFYFFAIVNFIQTEKNDNFLFFILIWNSLSLSLS